MSHWELVIGLEIHAQLTTRSKLFSGAPNRFGDEPNTNISVVCTGQPGALPVLNEEAVHKALLFGLATKATIHPWSFFDRKSYFYPDTPRNFQITQFHSPLLTGGEIIADVDGTPHTFFLDRAHLEDDAGMLKHFSTFTAIDYNRAGAPLIEIVSKPCIHSAKEASSYAKAIRSLLVYLGACDGNMEEGSLRMDVNLSVRKPGETTLRPRIEIKNLGSFSFMEMAIEAEKKRQIALYEKHPDAPFTSLIPPGTYRWDQDTKQPVLMRAKESADDYRYFPEPDLPPLFVSKELLDALRKTLPELPFDRYARYLSDLHLSAQTATVLIEEKWLSDYFEEALKTCPDPRLVANWITVEFAGRLKETGKTLQSAKLSPHFVGKLAQMIASKKITGKIGKALADAMLLDPLTDPEELVAKNPDFQPSGNADTLGPLIDTILQENPQSIADYRAGKDRAFGFLVGQVMKKTGGKAPPDIVNALLREKLS